MIRITEEYRIAPNKRVSLRHFCHGSNSFYMYGAPVSIFRPKGSDIVCLSCRKKVPDKILFIYNLWKWHND